MKRAIVVGLLALLASSVSAQTTQGGTGGGGSSSSAVILAGNQCTSAVGTDAYACSPAAPATCPASLAASSSVFLTTDVANTGASTFAYCGLAAKAIVRGAPTVSTATVTGDMLAAYSYLLQYNATGDNWKLLSIPASVGLINQANTWTGVQSFGAGTVTAPSIQGDGTGGIYFVGTLPQLAQTTNVFGAGLNNTTQSGSFSVTSVGLLGWTTSSTANGVMDAFFSRKAAAVIAIGQDINGAGVAQTFKSGDGTTGTDLTGSTLTLGAQVGTGAGAGGQTNINRALMRSTGTTAQLTANGFSMCETKTLSNTTATTTTLATIGAASNTSGGAVWDVSIQCNDGTNFDSETVQCATSWVNKATVFTVGTVVCTATTAANNSGSCTVASTVTGAASAISIKVTPVIAVITPTTVTSYINIRNMSPGAVACQ